MSSWRKLSSALVIFDSNTNLIFMVNVDQVLLKICHSFCLILYWWIKILDCLSSCHQTFSKKHAISGRGFLSFLPPSPAPCFFCLLLLSRSFRLFVVFVWKRNDCTAGLQSWTKLLRKFFLTCKFHHYGDASTSQHPTLSLITQGPPLKKIAG